MLICLVVGSPARSRTSDWTILVGPFQLKVFYDSMVILHLSSQNLFLFQKVFNNWLIKLFAIRVF